ncbi:hypothetical protein HY485_03960 [Candidatus Woesearchaeota archaeon]|nr:hypothetical protein [Candidatus Woesearchaeota archaeon]
MNLRNKYLVIAVRTLFGLFMLFSGVAGLLGGPSPKGVEEPMLGVVQALWKTGLFQMIKVTETVAGLMLVLKFYPALAAIFLAPVAVGIVIFNAKLSPSFVPIGLIICLFNAYLGYVYWDKYKLLFRRN